MTVCYPHPTTALCCQVAFSKASAAGGARTFWQLAAPTTGILRQTYEGCTYLRAFFA